MGNELVVVVYTVMYCRLSWENKVDLYIIVVVHYCCCTLLLLCHFHSVKLVKNLRML